MRMRLELWPNCACGRMASMDQQKNNREGSSVNRLLVAFSIIPIVLLGGYLIVIASLGVGAAVRNYDPEMAMFFTAATMGFIFGVLITVVAMQVSRRCNVGLTHFRIRDLLILMATLAIVFGVMSYILSKK